MATREVCRKPIASCWNPPESLAAFAGLVGTRRAVPLPRDRSAATATRLRRRHSPPLSVRQRPQATEDESVMPSSDHTVARDGPLAQMLATHVRLQVWTVGANASKKAALGESMRKTSAGNTSARIVLCVNGNGAAPLQKRKCVDALFIRSPSSFCHPSSRTRSVTVSCVRT
jgi:hypothetical protein